MMNGDGNWLISDKSNDGWFVVIDVDDDDDDENDNDDGDDDDDVNGSEDCYNWLLIVVIMIEYALCWLFITDDCA